MQFPGIMLRLYDCAVVYREDVGERLNEYLRGKTPLYTYLCASSAFPNAEDAYAGVAYLAAIFLPALPVPYFPRSVSRSPVPISLHAKIGRVILRGVPACVMPRRSFSIPFWGFKSLWTLPLL